MQKSCHQTFVRCDESVCLILLSKCSSNLLRPKYVATEGGMEFTF